MIPFFISLISLLLFPLIFPYVQLFFFAPYLVRALYKNRFIPLLWKALGCGLIIDLFAATPSFGLYALNYPLIAALLRPARQLFFEDKWITLPLMTALFSLGSTLIAVVQEPQPLCGRWLLTDCVLMPLFDALYALLFFVLPFHITKLWRKII